MLHVLWKMNPVRSCKKDPFDAQKLMPKRGVENIHEDLSFDVIDLQG